MDAKKPEQKTTETSEEHHVAAIEKQSEEIQRVGGNLQTPAEEITGVERRSLCWQRANVIATSALSLLTLVVLALAVYFPERAVVTFGTPDGRLMKMVCHGQGASLFTYFQNSGKMPALNVSVEVWSLYDDKQPVDVAAYTGINKRKRSFRLASLIWKYGMVSIALTSTLSKMRSGIR